MCYLGDLHDGLEPSRRLALESDDGGWGSVSLRRLRRDGAQVRDEPLDTEEASEASRVSRVAQQEESWAWLTTSFVLVRRAMSCCSPGDRS